MDTSQIHSPVTALACGGAGAACITESGSLYTIGDVCMQITKRFQKLDLPNGQKAKSVSVGYSFIVVSTSMNLFKILTK